MRCLYIERGAFRMRSASLSTNARFSLEQARSLRRPIEGMLRRRAGRRTRAGAVAQAALPALPRRQRGGLRGAPRRRFLQHTRFALMPYARWRWRSGWTAHHTPRNQGDARLGLEVVARSRRCRCRPIAVQTALAIRRQPGAARLRRPAGAPRRARRARARQTPSDGQRALPSAEGARGMGGNLARFYRHNPLVVCINSTVGFEAVTRGVPVICFGPSFSDTARQRCGGDAGDVADLRRAALHASVRRRPGARGRARRRRAALVPGAGPTPGPTARPGP